MAAAQPRTALVLFYFSVVCLAGIGRCFGTGGAADALSKPVVVRPEGARYTTVISLDAGGLRNVMAAVVLVRLEDAIKTHILEERPDLLPEGTPITSIDDFEVSLADYIDCFSGNSAASWIALYLASKGGNGFSQNIFLEKRFIQEYGPIRAGSARGLLVLFNEFSNTAYPQDQALPGPIGIPTGMDPTVDGFTSPIYDPEGLHVAMMAFLGNTTMADLSTSCLIPVFDLESGTAASIVYNDFADPPRPEYLSYVYRNEPRPLNASHRSDIRVDEGENYYARDVAVASTSAAILFPAANVTSIDGDAHHVLVEGAPPNPVLRTLVYVMNSLGACSVENVSMISIGSGHARALFADNANGGFAQWMGSGDFMNAAFNGNNHDLLNDDVDFFFYGNPRTRPGQYIRIQRFADPGTEEALLFSAVDRHASLPALQAIGTELADAYGAHLSYFVENFIFAV